MARTRVIGRLTGAGGLFPAAKRLTYLSFRRLVIVILSVPCVFQGSPSSYGASNVASEEVAVEHLTQQFGCEDIFVAKNVASTVVLSIRIPGIVARSRGAELPYREEIQIGGPKIIVLVEQGADLDHWCTDIMARPPRIDTTWVGVSGTAVVELQERDTRRPLSEYTDRPIPTRATLSLGPVTLERQNSSGDRNRIPELKIQATLGEPPGG